LPDAYAQPAGREQTFLILIIYNHRLYIVDFVIQLRELAEKAGVTANTVTRIENGADAKQSTMDRLQQALEAVRWWAWGAVTKAASEEELGNPRK
jgi:transcriptional regulator with XRE-family HTH domain